MKCLLRLVMLMLAMPAAALDVEALAPWLPTITDDELRSQFAQLDRPDVRDAEGYTLLHHALCDAPAQTLTLLTLGASGNASTPNGGNGLHHLFNCPLPSNASVALEAMAALITRGTLLNQLDNQGATPLHRAMARLNDPVHGRTFLAATNHLLATGAIAVSADEQGITPLHLAAASPYESLTEQLLSKGAKIAATDQAGNTPLAYAAMNNQLRQVQRLLEQGAEPTQGASDNGSLIPLALAHGRLPLIQTLARVTPNHTTRTPTLLRDYLLEGGRDKTVVEWLLLQGYDREARDTLGNTPLLIAAASGNQALAQMLVRYGADTRAINDSGCTIACYLRPELLTAQSGPAAWPALEERPLAYFVLAFFPAVTLYLLVLAVWLKQHRPAGQLTLALLAGLLAGLLLSTTLFYRCDPCLVAGYHQLIASGLLTLAITAILIVLQARRARIATVPDQDTVD